jgi:hypothetical protein
MKLMSWPDVIWLSMKVDGSVEAIWLLLLAAAKFTDLLDGKLEGSHPDDKIQSSRSPRSAPIDEG